MAYLRNLWTSPRLSDTVCRCESSFTGGTRTAVVAVRQEDLAKPVDWILAVGAIAALALEFALAATVDDRRELIALDIILA